MSELQPRRPFDGSPVGLRRADSKGLEIIDAVSGRACSLGFGNQVIADSIWRVAEDYLGDANRFIKSKPDADEDFAVLVRGAIENSKYVASESIHLCASSDAATELAIRFARRWGWR